jgi:hypothetical protein
VALWGLLYTYLPGVLVSCWQLLSRRPAVRLPGWIKAWMDGRKQLGLLSFAACEWPTQRPGPGTECGTASVPGSASEAYTHY